MAQTDLFTRLRNLAREHLDLRPEQEHGSAEAPYLLRDVDDPADTLWLVEAADSESQAIVEIVLVDPFGGRSMIVDQIPCPAIVGATAFTRWWLGGRRGGHALRSLHRIEAVGAVSVLSLPFQDLTNALDTPSHEADVKALMALALEEATRLQTQIPAALVAGPALRAADRVRTFLIDHASRGKGTSVALPANELRFISVSRASRTATARTT